MNFTLNRRQGIAAAIGAVVVGLLVLWIVRNSTQLPPAVPTSNYNTGALLMKNGTGCVNAAEQIVPCPPGTIVANTATTPSGPSSNFKIPNSPADAQTKSPKK